MESSLEKKIDKKRIIKRREEKWVLKKSKKTTNTSMDIK